MIETIYDYNQFVADSKGDWIVHVVPVKEDAHPMDNSPSILFIRVIDTNKTYYYAFNHPDSKPKISSEQFLNFLLQSENIKWALDRKIFCQYFKLRNVYDANLCLFLKENDILELNDFNTVSHSLIMRNSFKCVNINCAIPLMKHLEVFCDLCESIKKIIVYPDSSFIILNNVILEALGCLESNGIYVDVEKYTKYFKVKPNDKNMVFSQYNVYTSTGRPSNRFGGVNYAALKTNDGSRGAFVSRHGNDGNIVVVDYTAFHPRIICMLTRYNIDKNINIYEYLARLYFQKECIDDIDVSESKKLTFRQLYGGVEPKYTHIKYLANLKVFIDEQWKYFNKNGYVLTPIFKRKITDKHILDPSPSKVFNYILQAIEGEIAIPKLYEVLCYLADKKTKAILYTYDSVIYDFHKDDGIETLNTIRKIMNFNEMFSLKTYIGKSYQTVKQVSI